MEHEIELKLRLPAAAAARVARQPIVARSLVGAPRTVRMRTIYYDTADRELAAQGMALRVREVGRARTQTLKVAIDGGAGEALQRHGEWSTPIEGEGPDLARLGDQRLRARLERKGPSGGLGEVFRTEIARRTYPLAVGASAVAMALDRGEIRAGGRREEVCEIELELRSGETAALFEVAEALARGLPLHVEHRTKADRGHALALDRAPGPFLARPVRLDGAWSVRRGFVATARACLRQLYANEAAILAGSDAEAVHQLRVAIRRLRAAFAAFGAALDEAEADSFRAELRWLQRALGPARDWDVFLSETVEPLVRAMPDRPALRRLAEEGARAREDAYEAMRAALRSRRYALFQVCFERSLLAESEDDGSLGPFAARALARRDRMLRKAGAGLAGLSEERLHEVRIAAKKARYAAEFFRSLFGRKAAGRYAKSLRRIQDRLGVINDAAVARRLVDSLALGETEAPAILDGWFAARIADSKAGIGKLWGRFGGAPRFWAD